MKKYLKSLIFLSALVVTFGIIPQWVNAQPNPCTAPEVYCPIDGGVSLLVVAGVVVGLKKIREERKKKLNKLPNV